MSATAIKGNEVGNKERAFAFKYYFCLMILLEKFIQTSTGIENVMIHAVLMRTDVILFSPLSKCNDHSVDVHQG